MEIRVKFMHPANNMASDIAVEETMTINDMIEELIEANFISQSPNGYQAILKDGREPIQMDLNKTLVENGGHEGSTIRLISGINAGYR